MEIVESRDKILILDLKLPFIIVDYFSRRLPPKFFTMKLIRLIGFPGSSYLIIFIILLYMILTWYWYLFVLTRFVHNNLINNLGLKIVNSINRGLNFPTISSNHVWTCSNWLGCLYASLSQTLQFFWLKDKIAVWTGGQW